MKKIIGLALVFCLLFVFTADAFAAGKPKITKQPEDGTVKKGKVTFQIKVSGQVDSITWYLVNPDSGESISAKQLKKDKTFPKLGISGENGKKLSLSKVPDEMHGWSVYCHISGNGYKVDSDIVTILISGKEAPDTASSSDKADSKKEEAKPASDDPEDSDKAEDDSKTPDQSDDDNTPDVPSDEDDSENKAEAKSSDSIVTVTASARVLYSLDASGKAAESKPTSKLELKGPASFIVKSEDPISSWSVDGIRVTPAEPVYEFTISNVVTSISLDFNVQHKAASASVVDESKPCKVTCEGCTFTCIPKKLYSVAEGEVPSGSLITITAGNPSLAKNGYSINGNEPDYKDMSSFSLTVEEDIRIVLK